MKFVPDASAALLAMRSVSKSYGERKILDRIRCGGAGKGGGHRAERLWQNHHPAHRDRSSEA
jgi:hypothetical protein